jgi:hypothetical protein
MRGPYAGRLGHLVTHSAMSYSNTQFVALDSGSVPVAQRTEQPPSKRKVAGSNPAGGAIAARGHRQLKEMIEPRPRNGTRLNECG